jgi:O-acetylhomoserine (thiol)-lyase
MTAARSGSIARSSQPGSEQRRAGVRPETIRLSIEIRHIDHIIADLDRALAAAVPQSRAIAAE